jgi:hypothetical protein
VSRQLKETDMRFGSWNVRNMYRAVCSGQWRKKYQNISWIKWEYRRSDGTEVALNREANIYFSMERGNENHELGTVLLFVHMRIISAVKRVEFVREDICKPTTRNVSLHEISNDNGVRVVNFATTNKNLIVKSMFPHPNIHKFTSTHTDGKTHNQIDHILIGDCTQVYLMSDCSGQQIVILTTIWCGKS